MKKIISILLVLITALSLSACTKHTPKEEVDESKKEISDDQAFVSDFLLGSVNGQTYRNEFIGLEFTTDDDWKYLNHEEITEAKNVSLEAVSGDMKEELENIDFIDLMSAKDNAGSSVSISV